MICWWHRKLVNTEPILLYGVLFLLAMIALFVASAAVAANSGWSPTQKMWPLPPDSNQYFCNDRYCTPSLNMRISSPCERRMEAVMRAMEPYREKEWATTATGTIYHDSQFYDFSNNFNSDEPIQKTLDQQIAEIQERAKHQIDELQNAHGRQQERLGKELVMKFHRAWAFQEWETVKKGCWRNP